jgi:hypothetical protein
MAFNGSGVFVRLYNWVTDRANNIDVSADRMDAEMDGMATGLSTCITKDGQQTITNDIPWANHKITGLKTGTVRTDAANVGQVQDSAAQWSGTTGGTANAITVSTSPAITAYAAGQVVRFTATNNNTGATTIAWSGLTAKAAQWGGAAMVGGEIVTGRTYEAVYDGTNFQVMGITTATPSFGDTIIQTSSDAGAGAAPTFEQYRNSASPAANDLLGTINFTGQNSTPAKVTYAKWGVKLIDPTTASEDATFSGTVKSAGSDVSVLLDAFGLTIGSVAIGRVCEARLTLTSGVPVTTSDVTAATTVYLTPYKGNLRSVYNGSRWELRASSELSIGVPATTNTNYDVFEDYNSGTPQLVATAWTNDTTRASALALQDGVPVKSGTPTQVYRGTFRTTGVSGQTEDSGKNRYVWNNYNRIMKYIGLFETTDNWSYNGTYRQANGSTANQVNLVRGLDEDAVNIRVLGRVVNNTASIRVAGVGVGLDSTTINSATTSSYNQFSSSAAVSQHSEYMGYPGIGKHSLVWLEAGAGADTQTWYGDNGGVGAQSGMAGTTLA